MSKLEPTRTYSNLTATERLRAMLDERGVEWNATVGAIGTIWTHWDAFNGYRVHAMDNGDGTVEIFGEWDVTPEQAIAATLGCKEYVYALTAIDPEDGREYMLGIYATRELVEKSIETNGRGYTLHSVSRWEVVDE